MLHFGCATACSTLTPRISSRLQPRNGPPEAVRISRDTRSRQAGCSTWKIAECSESTGITPPPASLAVASSAGPAQIRLSLLASAITEPVRAAASVGARPADPTIADITQSAPSAAASLIAAAPAAAPMLEPFSRSRSSGSRLSSSITTWRGRQRLACSASRSTLRPPVSAIISTSAPACSSRSSVDLPTEPVDPRMETVRAAISAPTRSGRSAARRRKRGSRTSAHPPDQAVPHGRE